MRIARRAERRLAPGDRQGSAILWMVATLALSASCGSLFAGPKEKELFRWEPSLEFSGEAKGGLPQPINALNLAVHQGMLFVGTGTDFEREQFSGRSSYIFVKTSARADWKLDVNLGPKTSRVGVLYSATMINDAAGKPIAAGPQHLLLAGTIKTAATPGRKPLQVYLRNDQSGKWSTINIGDTALQEYNLRTAIVHRDTITGADLLILGASPAPLGPIAGSYDATARGGIRWASLPEPVENVVSPESKWFGLANVNGVLLGSTSRAIYRRMDGPQAHWVLVADLTAAGDAGGREVRGLTAVPNISAKTGWPESQMLLFTSQMKLWHMRVPADPAAAHSTGVELDLRSTLSKALETPVLFAEAAFNQLQPFSIGGVGNGPTFWPIGVQFVKGAGDIRAYRRQAVQQGGPNLEDLPRPAYYFLRDENAGYRLEAIRPEGNRMLFLARDFALSPFPQEAGVLYACGFNGSFVKHSLGTAWVYRGVSRDLPQP